ncbi:MAG: Lrp/AsnC family transcriptional regulator [Clostridiales bacterium]|nr:Lrp/AsnC family transcriptional regulator [Clostridiales bacterium]
MFLEGLDQLDRKIVELLIENARMSYSEIGKRVGVSRVAVKMRVQSLEQRGIIESYTTIVNPQKISGAVSCYFEMETAPGALDSIIEVLRQNGTVTQIYRVTGQNRLHVHAVAPSGEDMERLIREVVDPLPGLISSSCHMILSRIKDVKGLRL